MTNAVRAIAFAFLFGSTQVLACFPVPVPLAERVSVAQWIAVGLVTGKQRLPSAEITLPESYSLQILLAERLKGSEADNELNIDLPNCGAGSAGLHDKVLVFRNAESWYVSIATQN